MNVLVAAEVNGDMSNVGVRIVIEEHQIAALKIGNLRNERPCRIVGIAIGVETADVYADLPQAIVDKAGTVERIRAVASKYIRLAKLRLEHIYKRLDFA